MCFQSSTKPFELSKEERKQLWENHHELRKSGLNVHELFEMEGKEIREPLSAEPFVRFRHSYSL